MHFTAYGSEISLVHRGFPIELIAMPRGDRPKAAIAKTLAFTIVEAGAILVRAFNPAKTPGVRAVNG